ncbi:hypothetical protein [Streptomyces sp. SPB162]|uniref:hypothetical protein n=1 Tax=Streptomyces sp. SPB162 TaxID=2940560 RepID=UPI002406D8C8|nr:hypothetical protein [Streptomyces sp. SPB162]MDF9816732.1 hypothetical protein [Streptomyces sp. SPB162]
MTPAGDPYPDSLQAEASRLAQQAREFRLRMSVINTQTQYTLDTTRDRYGRTAHPGAAADALAHRNAAAVEVYTTYLAAHADGLLGAAHRALDELPPTGPLSAWREVLDSLATSHTEIVRVLDRPAEPDSAAQRVQYALVWPHLAAWADYGSVAADLAEQHHEPEFGLTYEERQSWTARAHAALRQGGALDLIESWHVADGRRITLAYLVEDDDSTVVALAGDPDASDWEIIGHYVHEYAAGQALPRAVPPGVLRPDAASRFNRPEPVPEQPLQELLREIIEARTAGDVSEVLLSATQEGVGAGAMVRLGHILYAAEQFSDALGTVRSQQIGARIHALARQLDSLMREVHDAAEDLGATVAVLPPHRVPKPPRIRPRPALETSPPAAPPPHTPATARRP